MLPQENFGFKFSEIAFYCNLRNITQTTSKSMHYYYYWSSRGEGGHFSQGGRQPPYKEIPILITISSTLRSNVTSCTHFSDPSVTYPKLCLFRLILATFPYRVQPQKFNLYSTLTLEIHTLPTQYNNYRSRINRQNPPPHPWWRIVGQWLLHIQCILLQLDTESPTYLWLKVINQWPIAPRTG